MDREMDDLPSADGDAEKLMNEKDEVDDEVWERHKVKKSLGKMVFDDLKWFVETYTVALAIYLVLMILFIAIGCTKLNLTYEAWMAGFIIILQIGWLTADVSPPHFVLFASMAMLMIWRVTTPSETITGFANTSVHTIGCVLVVTENMMRSGVMAYVARYMLGTPKFVAIGQIRLLYPVMCISGIVPDTPTVATFLPIVQKWIRQRGFSPSYFLMPLSFTALLGGTLTIIGTSTNLVVQGLIETYMLDIKIGFIDIATVGAPVAVAGVTYIIIFSQCCLPRKKDVLSDSLSKSREYTCAVRVVRGSPVEKMSIARSGLRHLDGLYLYEIERENGDILASPPPETILLGGDMLKFTGLVSSLAEVLRTDGLVSVEADQVQKLSAPSHQRVLVEAIISPNSWMVGRTPRSVEFRARFNSAIIAVARHGHRLNEKIGDIVFESADVLLLEAHADFVENYKFDENFVLVSELDEGSVAPIRSKPVMIFSVLCLIIPIVSSITYQYCTWDAQPIGYTLFPTLLLACCIIVILRFMTVSQALTAARLPILFTIAASFSLGTAVNNSGLGTEMANFLLPIFQEAGEFGVLLGLFVVVSLMNSFVSNAAAMTIMFPIAINFVDQKAIELRPMIYVMMMAGSADFCTPVGYQTNLMVYGPGGYKFLHYTVFGFPLMLLDALITCTICYFL